MTIWRMRIAYWIRRATNRLTEYVILNDFALQHPTNTPKRHVTRTVPILLAKCSAFLTVAPFGTNPFRRFLGNRISVKVNTTRAAAEQVHSIRRTSNSESTAGRVNCWRHGQAHSHEDCCRRRYDAYDRTHQYRRFEEISCMRLRLP
jgi:hypothetical protein